MEPRNEATPVWLSPLRSYLEREDLRVELRVPIVMPSGRVIKDLPAVSMRFPRWEGAPFVDDFGRKAAGLIELDGEHLLAELCSGFCRRPAGAAAGSTPRADAARSGSI
jgi:hypothetical protein